MALTGQNQNREMTYKPLKWDSIIVGAILLRQLQDRRHLLLQCDSYDNYSTFIDLEKIVININRDNVKEVKKFLFENNHDDSFPETIAKKYVRVRSEGMSPSEFYNHISNIWKGIPEVEYQIKHTYLCELAERKQYTEFKQLISDDIDSYCSLSHTIEKYIEFKQLLCANSHPEWYYSMYDESERIRADAVLMEVLHSVLSKQESRGLMFSPEELYDLGLELFKLKIQDLKTYITINVNCDGLQASEFYDNLHDLWKSMPEIEMVIKLAYLNNLWEDRKTDIFNQLIARDITFFKSVDTVHLHYWDIFVQLMIQTHHRLSQLPTEENEELSTLILSFLRKTRLTDGYIINYINTTRDDEQSLEVLWGLFHQVWKNWPEIEVKIKLIYCQMLLENNEYQAYQNLIFMNEDLFVKHSGLYLLSKMYDRTKMHQIILLHCVSLSKSKENTEHILKNLKQLHRTIVNSNNEVFGKHCKHLCGQILSCTCIRKLLRCKSSLSKSERVTIAYQFMFFVEFDSEDNVLQLMKCNPKLLSFVDRNTMLHINSKGRNNYRILLLRLLHEYDKLEDTNGIDATVKAIFDLRGLLTDHVETFFLPFQNQNDNFCVGTKEITSLLDINDDSKLFEWLHSELELISYSATLILWNIYARCPDLQKTSASPLIKIRTGISSYVGLTPQKEDIIVSALVEELHVKYFKQNLVILAKLALYIGKSVKKSSTVSKLIISLGKLLGLKENSTENDVIYKCFCLLRQTKKSEEHLDIDLNKYKEHFSFIALMDKQEDVRLTLSKILTIIMLLLWYSSNCQQVKSAELKKYLSLKYEYDDGILYLLWCSGDVEVNPGPSFSKPKRLPDSQNLRNWIYSTCSSLLKLLDASWKRPPKSWPKDQKLIDPRNKSKACNSDNMSDENLLDLLLKCCKNEDTAVPMWVQNELNAWKNKNNALLFELYICRERVDEIVKSTQFLLKYKTSPTLKKSLLEIKVSLNFDRVSCKTNPSYKCKAEIIRDLAVMLCKICKRLNPHEKTDGIWNTPPDGWDIINPFYSPHNAGKKQENRNDNKLLENLFSCYKSQALAPDYREMYKHIISDCEEMYKAWKQPNDKLNLKEIYVIHSSTAAIKNCLQHLESQHYLQNQSTIKELEAIGISQIVQQIEPEKRSGSAVCVAEVGCSDTSKISTKKRKQTEKKNCGAIKRKRQTVSSTNEKQNFEQSYEIGSSSTFTTNTGNASVAEDTIEDFLDLQLESDQNNVDSTTLSAGTKETSTNTSAYSVNHSIQIVNGISHLETCGANTTGQMFTLGSAIVQPDVYSQNIQNFGQSYETGSSSTFTTNTGNASVAEDAIDGFLDQWIESDQNNVDSTILSAGTKENSTNISAYSVNHLIQIVNGISQLETCGANTTGQMITLDSAIVEPEVYSQNIQNFGKSYETNSSSTCTTNTGNASVVEDAIDGILDLWLESDQNNTIPIWEQAKALKHLTEGEPSYLNKEYYLTSRRDVLVENDTIPDCSTDISRSNKHPETADNHPLMHTQESLNGSASNKLGTSSDSSPTRSSCDEHDLNAESLSNESLDTCIEMYLQNENLDVELDSDIDKMLQKINS